MMNGIFLRIVNLSITAAICAAVVILLRSVLKKCGAPRWINGILWALVGIRMLLPISITSPVSLQPSAQPLADDSFSRQIVIASGEISLIPENAAPSAVIAPSEPVDSVPAQTEPQTGAQPSASPAAQSAPKWIALSDLLAAIWLCGFGGMLLYAILSYLRIARCVSASIPLGGRLYLCDEAETPFILGLLRPRIILPSGLSEEAMQSVIAHENAHLSRRDHLIKPLGFLLLSLHWFNPVLWIAYILLCRDIEVACDEKAIRAMEPEARALYSETLLTFQSRRRIAAVAPLAFGEVGVKERVKSVLNYKKPAFWAIVVAILACVAVCVFFLTDPVKAAPAQPENSEAESSEKENEPKLSPESIAEGRAILSVCQDKLITYRADFPEGYTLRNNYDSEHREETRKRTERREDFGFYEILKDGEPVVNITEQQPEYTIFMRSQIAYFKGEIEHGTSAFKKIDYLEQKRREDGCFYLYYFAEENRGITKYTYILDFPKDTECSIELWAYDSEEAERFFELMDFRSEDMANEPGGEESSSSEAASSEAILEPVEWSEPDHRAGSFDYNEFLIGEDSYVIHIDYSVPEGYEVMFPNLLMIYDNPRYVELYSERLKNPTSGEPFLQIPQAIEVSKDGVTVFAARFITKPRYYEITLPILVAVNMPRQEAFDQYYDDFEQFEREDGLFLVAKNVTLVNGEEQISGIFGGLDLSSSEKMAVAMYASSTATTQELKEYASWFGFRMVRDPEGEAAGYLRRADDPLPTFGNATLENELGSVLVSYYTYDGFELSYPRASDPAAENDLEITKDGKLVYAARIIPKAQMQRLKAQYDADPDLKDADIGSSSAQLRNAGKREYDYQLGGEAHHYYSLTEFLKSDAVALFVESYTTRDGTWENSFFPTLTYTLLPLEE